MADSTHFDKKITFLVNNDLYLRYKIALLSLHRQSPEEYPANPSLAFRRLMRETIAEYEEKGGSSK